MRIVWPTPSSTPSAPIDEFEAHQYLDRAEVSAPRMWDTTARVPPIPMTLAKVIEALLFSAQKPLPTDEIVGAIRGAGAEDDLQPNQFAKVRDAEVAATLEQLKIEYIQQERAFQLVEKAEGWQLATDPTCAPWVRQLFPGPKPARLSAPALETLAIIAYRQPITRADVEAVRGVTIDGVLQTLMERGLVKISGRAEIPGRPLLYETTQFFLEHFALRSLDELPNAEELRKRYLPMAPQPQPEAAPTPIETATAAPDQTAAPATPG
jgi:segregation and condensation protein B